MDDTAFSKIVAKNRNNWTKAEICIYELWSDVLGKEYISIEAAEYVSALEAVAEAARNVILQWAQDGGITLDSACIVLGSRLSEVAALRKAQE